MFHAALRVPGVCLFHQRNIAEVAKDVAAGYGQTITSANVKSGNRHCHSGMTSGKHISGCIRSA